MIVLSLLVFAGCSSDPRLEADRAVDRANEEIAAHDESFEEARNSYSESQQAIREEAENNDEDSEDTENSDAEGTEGEDTSAGSPASGSISEARDSMEEARGRLQNAREEIAGIRELEVDGELREYSRTLEGALEAQIRAEEREIAFYEILAEDPTLEENRDRAIGLLSEAEDAYAEAKTGYEEASEIADSNPDLVAPEGGGGGS